MFINQIFDTSNITDMSRRRKGQKTFIIDPWDEVNRCYGNLTGISEKITNFNPLDTTDSTSESYADDLAYITDALTINQGNEAHWTDSARELVAGLIAYCKSSRKRKRTMSCLSINANKETNNA